jgi:hypothetical protein
VIAHFFIIPAHPEDHITFSKETHAEGAISLIRRSFDSKLVSRTTYCKSDGWSIE